MPANPEAEIKELVTRMRASADELQGRTKLGTNPGAAIDLRQGANTIEDLLVLAWRARDVFDIAARKGCLFVTDETTGSDNLVGFFVPVAVMNRLGEQVVTLEATG